MPSGEPVSLLLANEQAEEVKLTTISMRGFYPGCRVESVYSVADALEWSAKDDWHVILLDEHLAQGKELLLLPELKKRAPNAAIIVQAERSDTTMAMQVMHAGADYYLFKESPAFLSELLIVTRKIVQQRELNRRLDLSQERYLRLLETMTDIAYELDADGRFRFVSPLVSSVLGYKPEELIGNHYSNLLGPADRQLAECRFNERRTGSRSSRNIELRLLARDTTLNGRVVEMVEINATGLYDRHRRFVGTLGVIRSRARLIAPQLYLSATQDQQQVLSPQKPVTVAEDIPLAGQSGHAKADALATQGAVEPAQDLEYLERRRSPRLKVRIEARLTHDEATWTGWAADLSLGGVFLIFDGPVPASENQPIQLGLVSDAGVLEIGGAVRAIREAAAAPSPATSASLTLGLAIKFATLETTETKILASLLVGLREGSISLTVTALLVPQETGDLLIEVGSAESSIAKHRAVHPCADSKEFRERRLSPRVNLALPVEFIASEGPAGRRSCVTANLGIGGVCLRLQAQPDLLARRVLLRVLPPPSPDNNVPAPSPEVGSCTVIGEIIWSGPETITAALATSESLLRAGFRFVQITEDTRRRIADLVTRSLIVPVRVEERSEGSRIVSVSLEDRNLKDQRIALYHDHARDPLPADAPLVIILPAYGETKKEYITLAYYFASNGFHVLRYDHSNHVGESDGDIKDFTLTGMKNDLFTVLDHAKKSWPDSPIAVAATSLAGRVALKAASEDERIQLLVLVVGIVDLQATLLAVHQEDLVGTYLTGLRRGVVNVLGFNVDLDRFLEDAITQGYADLQTTLRDAGRIHNPVVLFTAENDVWVRLDSVQRLQDALQKSLRHRYLIPEALHRLHENPRKARAVFRQLVSCCLQWSRPQAGDPLVVEPPQREIGLQGRLERERSRARHQMDKTENIEFWRDYLDHFHYIVNFSDYWHLLDHIYRLIGTLDGSQRILDAGCGNGNFGTFLMVNHAYRQRGNPAIAGEWPHYVAIDFIPSALAQARLNFKRVAADFRDKMSAAAGQPRMAISLSLADLNMPLPFRDNQFDRIVCNLVLAYVQDPVFTLRELMRALAPHGRLVVTNLKPQADLSQIFRNFVQVTERPEEVEEARQLLNNSGKIKQGESEGIFRFFERQEFAMLLLSCGAHNLRTYSTFANQAYIAVAEKPGPLANQQSAPADIPSSLKIRA